MRVYFSIHPIDETICVVDLRQILRQQELYEAEYELVLRNSHFYTNSDFRTSRLYAPALRMRSMP